MPTCHGWAWAATAYSGIATRDRPLMVPTISPRLSSAGRCGTVWSCGPSGVGKCGVGLGETTQLCVGAAERQLDRQQALEPVAELQLVGHADAAVQLHRLLRDETAALPDHHLGGGQCAR